MHLWESVVFCLTYCVNYFFWQPDTCWHYDFMWYIIWELCYSCSPRLLFELRGENAHLAVIFFSTFLLNKLFSETYLCWRANTHETFNSIQFYMSFFTLRSDPIKSTRSEKVKSHRPSLQCYWDRHAQGAVLRLVAHWCQWGAHHSLLQSLAQSWFGFSGTKQSKWDSAIDTLTRTTKLQGDIVNTILFDSILFYM